MQHANVRFILWPRT